VEYLVGGREHHATFAAGDLRFVHGHDTADALLDPDDVLDVEQL
jgi:hypothetical protein